AADESEHEPPEPTRALYLEALLLASGGRLLVRTASPWAAAALVAELQVAMPQHREALRLWLPGRPEPSDGALVVAPYGPEARNTYTDTVLYHPPYHDGQIPPGRVHLLWAQTDWALAEASLAWPYPDRDVLVQTYKLLKAGETQPEALARALTEAPGPWNQARWQAATHVFREIGLADGSGRLTAGNGVKFQLEESARYRAGLAGRASLQALQASNWPDAT
ncbi:MAG TPA: hypothetical protein VK464_08685, partial [Symbiobacteriaceae bacterium]|nr:hypothetical protein [Symbiobacteriaceae bacterium]